MADLLAETAVGDDIGLLIGAVLHDTIEDTATDVTELSEGFGSDVLDLVLEVTDDKSLPKEERKRLQIEKSAGKSPRARLLKIADKTSNVRAMVVSPPAGWPHDRIVAYIDWGEAVVTACLSGEVPFETAAEREAADVLAGSFAKAVAQARRVIAAAGGEFG